MAYAALLAHVIKQNLSHLWVNQVKDNFDYLKTLTDTLNSRVGGAIALSLLAPGSALQQIRTNAGATATEWFTPEAYPVFAAFVNASVNNVTGNGAVYTPICNTATIAHAGYSTGTSIFTVPAGAAGNYEFSCKFATVPSATTSQGILELVTTQKTYRYDFPPYTVRHAASGVSMCALTLIVPMAVGETAFWRITFSGSGANDTQIVGSATIGWSTVAGKRVPS